MPTYYDKEKRTWYAKFRYKDWTGKSSASSASSDERYPQENSGSSTNYQQKNDGLSTEMMDYPQNGPFIR